MYLRISLHLRMGLMVPPLFALALCCPDYAISAMQSSQLVPFAISKGQDLELVARRRRARTHVRPTPKPSPDEAAEEETPPLPDRAPPEIRPKPVQAKEPQAPPKPPPTLPEWSVIEVRDAAFECGRLLPDKHFDFKILPPMREGDCGLPVPISLKYINQVPRVELRPAAKMSCRLADALDRWLRDVVQPQAKALLDANVIRLGNLDAYDCRTRYGDPNQKISQHAFGAALDISEFVTAKGEHVRLVDSWNAKGERGQFLKEVHKGACGIFGTVLGPDANEAHNNHFHLDMTPRRHSAVCE